MNAPPISLAADARREALLDALLDLSLVERNQRLDELAQTSPAETELLREWLAAIDASAGFLERDASSPAEAHMPDAAIGPWRLVHLLGRGGMGEVWLGNRADGAFEKNVAIKFIREDSSALRERLMRERAVLARLEHPGIARLLDGGVSGNGEPYLVTEFVDGVTLAQWCREEHPHLDSRLAAFRAIALAVAYAHGNLVIHRDIKPANILIDRDGRPRLLDFGIAKLLDDITRGETAERALTPEFAAPEQITGAAITTHTDIYALGGLLYWLLTGHAPIDATNLPLALLVRRVCEEMPVPPSQMSTLPEIARRKLRGDLDAIVLKALAKAPEDRYPSVDVLLADLDNAREHRPVIACHAGHAYRALRYLRRHRLSVAVGAIIVGALSAGLAGTLWQARVAANERDITSVERDAAQAETHRSEAAHDVILRMFRRPDVGNRELTVDQVLAQAVGEIEREVPAANGERDMAFAELGQLQYQRGDLRSAAMALQRIRFAEGSGISGATRVRAECQLANIEIELGNSAEATRWLTEGMRHGQALHGSAQLAMLPCRITRSIQIEHGGDMMATVEYDRDTLRQLETMPGVAPSLLADAHKHLGRSLNQAAHYHDAVAEYRKAIALHQHAGRSESVDVAETFGDIANAQLRAGLLREAELNFAQAIAMHRRANGPSSWLAEQLVHYSQLKTTLDQPLQSERLLDEAETMQASTVSDSSFQHLLLLWERARTQAMLGDRQAALASEQASRRIIATQFPAGSYFFDFSDLLHATIMQLTCESDADRDEARHSIDRAIAGLRRDQTPGHRLLPVALSLSARIALDQNRTAAALQTAREARDLLIGDVDPNGWQLPYCDALIAAALAQSGDMTQARTLLESALPKLKMQLGEQHRRVHDAERWLAAAQR